MSNMTLICFYINLLHLTWTWFELQILFFVFFLWLSEHWFSLLDWKEKPIYLKVKLVCISEYKMELKRICWQAQEFNIMKNKNWNICYTCIRTFAIKNFNIFVYHCLQKFFFYIYIQTLACQVLGATEHICNIVIILFIDFI